VNTPRDGRRSAETARTRPVAREESPTDIGGGNRLRVGIWFLVFLVLVLAVAIAMLWGFYVLRGQWASTGPTPTYIIWTPSPAPTSLASPTPDAPATSSVEEMPTVSPGMSVGTYVRVKGTGGSGLNLRSAPGETAARMDVALEGEIFVIVGGPTVAGGTEWWQLQDPDAPTRRWWAAANFLDPVEQP